MCVFYSLFGQRNLTQGLMNGRLLIYMLLCKIRQEHVIIKPLKLKNISV